MGARRSLPVIAIFIVLAGCGNGPPAPPSPVQAASPVPTVAASSTGVTAQPPLDLPPDALLAVPGAPPVRGDLGSWVFRGQGSEAPWLPGEPVVVPANAPLVEVTLTAPLGIERWSAKVAPAGARSAIGAVEVGSGSGRIAFRVRPGVWTLVVSVDFADGIGSAAYFWRLGQG